MFIIYGIVLIIISITLDKSALPDYAVYLRYIQSNIILEPSFMCIRWIVKSFAGGEPILFFSIFLILGISIKLYAFKHLTNLLLLTLLLYICSYWTLHELIQIRAGVASSFFLLALKPLYDRNAIKYFILCIIAMSFHFSAILMLPLWYIKGKNISTNNFIIYMMIIPISMFMYTLNIDIIDIISYIPIPYIQEKITNYSFVTAEAADRGVITASEYNPFSMWFLIKVVITYYIWFNIKKIYPHNHYVILLIKIQTIGLSLLWFISSIPVIAIRCSEFISIVQIILIPLAIYTIKQRRIGHIIPTVFCIIWIIWNINSFELI